MLTLKPDFVWTEEGLRAGLDVTVHADRIVGLGVVERQPEDGPVDVVPLPGRILVPGFVDAHSHAFQRAFRGHVQWKEKERDDFWTWREAMYATATRLSPEGVEAVSRLSFLELAEAGVTQVGEFHYLHHHADGTPYADPDELARRVIAAALDVGIRIALLRVAYYRHSAGRALAAEQRRFGDRTPDDVLAAVSRLSAGADPRVSVGLAPHSVRAVPWHWLVAFSGFRGPIHAHVSEQPAENEACRAEHGRSPLQVFADAGLVDARFTAVHLTHPIDGDLATMRATGATIAVCPSTELDLGDGFLPVEARDRIRLCVGSDSHAVSDILGEARALEMHGRALARRRNVMAPAGARHGVAERLLRAASMDGATALGGEGRGIAIGALADLVAVDLRRPAAEGVPPLEAVALLATPEWISDSWVGGRRVVSDGRHPRRDSIVAAARPYLSV